MDTDSINIDLNTAAADITLIVGETRFSAHRAVLANSEVFQIMLMKPEWGESNESIINLHETASAQRVFPFLLEYFYSGQAKFSVDNVQPLFSLADKYIIKDLIVLCRDYMMKSIALAGQNGLLITWLQYCAGINYLEQLTNELKTFLILNFEIVGNGKDFVDLEVNNLCTLLQQNDLVVTNEAKLFEIVERWLMQKKQEIDNEKSLLDEEKQSEIKSLVMEVCNYVRFPMMTVNELASIPLRPITSICKEYFCDKIAMGMCFQADSDLLQYTPRLYNNGTFCLEMTVSEILKVEHYKNFEAPFYSLEEFPYCDSSDENEREWKIEFFPKGIHFERVQLKSFVWSSPFQLPSVRKLEVSESKLRTCRVRCTCMIYRGELRFKIAVLISGFENNITYRKSIYTRTSYFSGDHRVINLDNLIPFEELDNVNSIYFIGENRDTLKINVIIVPFNKSSTQDSPSFDIQYVNDN